MSDLAAVPIDGHFTKRAKRTISQAALFDLVQDMAVKVDELPGYFALMNEKLDAIMEKLNASD